MTFLSRHHVPNADLTRSPDDPRYIAPVEEVAVEVIEQPKVEQPKPKKKAKK